MLQPILILGTQAFTFHWVLKIQVDDYLLFLASGLLPWLFISQTIEISAGILLNTSPLIRSFGTHPIILVAAQNFDNFLNFMLSLAIAFCILSFFYDLSIFQLVIALLVTFTIFFGVLALGFLASMIQVFFRDFRFILSFLFQILYFLTPVFYPMEMIPADFRDFLSWNPILAWIQPLRDVLLQGQVGSASLLYSLSVSIICWILAWTFWKRKGNELGRYLN
jgi:ABC-type polysaccharide/polyol phosphate export permease